MKLDMEKLSRDFLRDTSAYKKNIYELTLNPICAIILVGKEKIISLKTPKTPQVAACGVFLSKLF